MQCCRMHQVALVPPVPIMANMTMALPPPIPGRVNADGTFSFTGIAAGSYVFQVDAQPERAVIQKTTFVPNCIWRAGSAVLKIRPKFGLKAIRPGISKCGVLSALKTSHRNSMRRFSASRKFL